MKSKYLIIGAGVHGLSTAWNLCKKLKKKNQLKDNSVIVLEKTIRLLQAQDLYRVVLLEIIIFNPQCGN